MGRKAKGALAPRALQIVLVRTRFTACLRREPSEVKHAYVVGGLALLYQIGQHLSHDAAELETVT